MSEKAILLVEDNEDDVVLTARALKLSKIPHRLVVVRNGAEAVDYLFCEGIWVSRDKNINPALIFLDLKLPKLDGLKVLQRLRSDERLKDIPVVVLTSSKDQEDMVKSYNLGANSFIKKPDDVRQFVIAVQELGLPMLFSEESADSSLKPVEK